MSELGDSVVAIDEVELTERRNLVADFSLGHPAAGDVRADLLDPVPGMGRRAPRAGAGARPSTTDRASTSTCR